MPKREERKIKKASLTFLTRLATRTATSPIPSTKFDIRFDWQRTNGLYQFHTAACLRGRATEREKEFEKLNQIAGTEEKIAKQKTKMESCQACTMTIYYVPYEYRNDCDAHINIGPDDDTRLFGCVSFFSKLMLNSNALTNNRRTPVYVNGPDSTVRSVHNDQVSCVLTSIYGMVYSTLRRQVHRKLRHWTLSRSLFFKTGDNRSVPNTIHISCLSTTLPVWLLRIKYPFHVLAT